MNNPKEKKYPEELFTKDNKYPFYPGILFSKTKDPLIDILLKPVTSQAKQQGQKVMEILHNPSEDLKTRVGRFSIEFLKNVYIQWFKLVEEHIKYNKSPKLFKTETFPSNLPPVNTFAKKEYQQWVKLEAQLGYKVDICAKKLFELSVNNNYQYSKLDVMDDDDPAILLSGVVSEQKLVLFSFHSGEKIPLIKDFIRCQQKINTNLKGLISPWPINKEKPWEKHPDCPDTALFISVLIDAAEKYQDFKKEYYLPMVKARVALTTFLKENKAQRYLLREDGTIERYTNHDMARTIRYSCSKPY